MSTRPVPADACEHLRGSPGPRAMRGTREGTGAGYVGAGGGIALVPGSARTISAQHEVRPVINSLVAIGGVGHVVWCRDWCARDMGRSLQRGGDMATRWLSLAVTVGGAALGSWLGRWEPVVLYVASVFVLATLAESIATSLEDLARRVGSLAEGVEEKMGDLRRDVGLIGADISALRKEFAPSRWPIPVALLALLLTGCATTPVITLRHADGRVTKCGGLYASGGATETAAAIRESQCIQDFQRQGYERVPE